MRKLMSRVFLRESLLIFWNINVLVALSEGEQHTIWETSMPSSMVLAVDVPHLPNDTDLREFMEAGESKKFFYQHTEDDSVNISFFVSPCKRAEIRWILKYTENNEIENAVTLAEYIGTDYDIYVGKANRGFYWLEIHSSSMARFMYSVYVTLRASFVQLLREVKYNNHQRSITLKKNLTEPSLSMKWPNWNWTDGAVKYKVIISERTFTACNCEWELYNRAFEAVITHNTSYKMTEPAKPEEKYYISIFIETNFFLLPYLRGSVTFPKNKPIALKDGVATRGHLSSKNNKLTYRYKVRNRQYMESNNEIIWYVISCVGSIYVEINHKKDAIIGKQTVHRYKVFKTPQPKRGNRYVMKIVDSGRETGQVEVFATMRPKLFKLPNVHNFTVTSVRNEDYNVIGRSSVVIAWHAAFDEEIVSYCVFYAETEISDDENFNNIEQCNRNTMIANMTKLATPCRKEKRGNGRLLTEYINNLDETADYLVYVGARKRASKRRIWYNPIKIRGKNESPMTLQ